MNREHYTTPILEEEDDVPSTNFRDNQNMDIGDGSPLQGHCMEDNGLTGKIVIPTKVLREIEAAKILYVGNNNNNTCIHHNPQHTQCATYETEPVVGNIIKDDKKEMSNDISPYFTYFCPGIPTYHNSDGMMTKIVGSTNVNMKMKINEVARTCINDIIASSADNEDESGNNDNNPTCVHKGHESDDDISSPHKEKKENVAISVEEDVQKPILPYSRVTIDYRLYSALPRSYYPKLTRRAQKEQQRLIKELKHASCCDDPKSSSTWNSETVTGVPSGKSKSTITKRIVIPEQHKKDHKENPHVDVNDKRQVIPSIYELSKRMEVKDNYFVERKRAMEDTRFCFGVPLEKSLGAKIAPDFFHGPYEEVNGLEIVMEDTTYSDGTKISSSVVPVLTKALSLLHEGDTAVVLVPAYLGSSPVMVDEVRSKPVGDMWSLTHGKEDTTVGSFLSDVVYPPYIPFTAMTRGGVFQKRSVYNGSGYSTRDVLHDVTDGRGRDDTTNRSTNYFNPNENYNFHGRYMPDDNALYEFNAEHFQNNYAGHGGNCFMYIHVRSVIHETDLSHHVPHCIKSRYIVKHLLVPGDSALELSVPQDCPTHLHPITGSAVTFDISEVCPHMDYFPKIVSNVDGVPTTLGQPAFQQRIEDMVVGGVHSCEELDIMLRSMVVNESASFRVGGSTVYIITLLSVTIPSDADHKETISKCGRIAKGHHQHNDGEDAWTTYILEHFKCTANKLLSATQKWNGSITSSLESPTGNSPPGHKQQQLQTHRQKQHSGDKQSDATGIGHSCTTYSATSTPVISAEVLSKELLEACESGTLVDVVVGGCNRKATMVCNQGRNKILNFLSTVPMKAPLMSYKQLVLHEIHLISGEFHSSNSVNSHIPIQINSSLSPILEEIYWKTVYLYYTGSKLLLSAEANTNVGPMCHTNHHQTESAASKSTRLSAVSTLYSNATQAFLYLKEYRLAAYCATQALSYDHTNTKALYRRALAYLSITKSLRAQQDTVDLSQLEHDIAHNKLSCASEGLSVETEEFARCKDVMVRDVTMLRSVYVSRGLPEGSPDFCHLVDLESEINKIL